jgi:hypothetical protein
MGGRLVAFDQTVEILGLGIDIGAALEQAAESADNEGRRGQLWIPGHY